MRKTDNFYFLVEGDCEKKLLETFKEQKNLIISGKISRFNVIQEKITKAFLRTIKDNTIFILVFDTDTASDTILAENINFLNKQPHVKDVWCVLQINNLEDELIRSTDVTEIKRLTGSKSNTEYKHDLIIEKRLYDKLKKHHFDFGRIWVSSPNGVFKSYRNDGKKIKL